MKTRKLLVLFWVSIISFGFSQQYTIDLPLETILTSVKYDSAGESGIYAFGDYAIGRLDGTGDPFNPNTWNDTYRVIHAFNISQIPDTAILETVELSAGFSFYDCNDCSADIVGVFSSLNGDPQATWQAVGASNTTYYTVTYDSVSFNFPDTANTMKDDLADILATSDFFKIGIISNDENTDESQVLMTTLSLKVTYSLPTPAVYEVIVHNSFGDGLLKVDGNTVNSGTSFSWEVNSQHTLEAFDQDYPQPNNYYRVFQDKWIEGPNEFTQNPLTITITKDATYEADFLKRFDFEVTHLDFLNGGSGGSIKIDGVTETLPYFSHIIETNSLDLEAPQQQQMVGGKSVTYKLLKWSDGEADTQRNLTPTDHTELYGTMKGQQVSNNTDATAGNNSRKVVWAEPGATAYYFQTYLDNGHVYYSYSRMMKTRMNRRF